METKKAEQSAPRHIEVRGARVHNLKNIDVDIPLGPRAGAGDVSRRRFTGAGGVSSLAAARS